MHTLYDGLDLGTENEILSFSIMSYFFSFFLVEVNQARISLVVLIDATMKYSF